MRLVDRLADDTGILILGKRQGTKATNHQLHGRVALAAGLWHSARHPALPVFYLAADTHGPARTHDGVVVARLLTERYRIPAGVVHLRRWSRCTLVEVRAMRALARARRLRRILAITHPYHARRTGTYFAQIGLETEVLPVHPATLAALPFPAELPEMWREIQQAVRRSLPRRLDLLRERTIESLLGLVHRIDARGRMERRLANLLRP